MAGSNCICGDVSISRIVLLVRDSRAQATAIELWLDIGLANADALDLIKDMQAVLERYRMRGNDNEPRYLVHLAAVKAQG